METPHICSQCSKEIGPNNDIGTGYAIDSKDNKICYSCCGENDSATLAALNHKERTALYYNGQTISNWPGSLTITPYYTKQGKHNIARTRIDVWFKHKSKCFHGVRYGNNSEILHVRTVKNF